MNASLSLGYILMIYLSYYKSAVHNDLSASNQNSLYLRNSCTWNNIVEFICKNILLMVRLLNLNYLRIINLLDYQCNAYSSVNESRKLFHICLILTFNYHHYMVRKLPQCHWYLLLHKFSVSAVAIYCSCLWWGYASHSESWKNSEVANTVIR